MFHRIPKAARKLAAQSLTDRTPKVVELNTDLVWRELILFALTGLKKPEPQKGKKQNLTSTVKETLSRPKMVVGSAEKAKKGKNDSTDATLKKIVEGKLNDADIRGALRVLSSEDILIYGQHILASARGVQLAYLFGPMLFCLAIEALTKKLTSPFNLWYWDDGTIGGDCSKVLADLCTVISEGMRIGLELNPSKCELFLQGGTSGERERIRRAFSLVCPGIIFPSRAELTLLEAPLLQEVLEPAIEEKRERIALPAFMASIHSVQALVLSIYPENDLDSVVNGGLDHWPLLTSAELPVPALRRQQRVRDLPMVTEEFGSPIDQSDMTSRARLMAVSTKTFGTWLRALPASSLGNLLDDNTLRISVGLRLGSRLCQPTCAAVEK
ncbi:hypothetical protein RvY_10896 [Ramazzottius varieornatus]|uniref:Reverse transcriptase domain-containing protein n=1 Tax=Ramazzottius varieornatus TaxID=947166 RepID=A0A1D1VJQ0_RAMVA|nr:hypothetical protein RvY_10896 [Ramazzottius varieornatus]